MNNTVLTCFTLMRRLLPACVALPLLCATNPVQAEVLTIAVASNFSAPMQEISQAFEAESGHSIRLTFGSSGKLYAQIIHGAPFHAMFSADQAIPARLERENLTVPGSRFTYAQGKLVLWSMHTNAVDRSGTALQQGNFSRLALANPRLAPYGAAAVQTLQALNLVEATRDKWVQGENVSQTFQYVATGNAELGLVAMSQVMRNGELVRGSAWVVPPVLYEPIRQDAVMLRNGKDSGALRDFWRFMRSDFARKRMATFGYDTPPGKTLAPPGEHTVDHQ